MNCPKCNAVIADGHRFCTECGYRVVEESAPVAVQEPVVETEPAEEEIMTSDMNDVDNHIMWNVQPGQVAKLITEKEFAQYSDAAGLIINEGARVLIRTNADDLTMLSSGIYKFPKPVAETQTNSGGFISNLFTSANKKSDAPVAP